MIYDTLGLVDDVSDEEFDARFRALDPEELKKDSGGDVIWVNGPRRALTDRMTLMVFEDAKISMVGPIPMRTAATVSLPDPDPFLASEQPPYTEMTVGRTTECAPTLEVPRRTSSSTSTRTTTSASTTRMPRTAPGRLSDQAVHRGSNCPTPTTPGARIRARHGVPEMTKPVPPAFRWWDGVAVWWS